MAARLLEALWVTGYGSTAASGYVFFYQPGTLTPVSVYSNDAATSVVTQPVRLDANGRTSSPLYLKAPARCIIQNSGGATLVDIERIDGDRAELVALANTSWPGSTSENAAWTVLATSLGGTDGSVKVTGAGAVARTAQAKFSEAPSVKDFGAKGDGVTDDLGAFTAAIVYAAGIGGSIIYVPAGNYLVSAAIVITNNGISFKGTGSLSSVITNSSTSGNALTINGSRLFVEDIGITASTTSTGNGVLLGSGASYVTLSRLRITAHQAGVMDTGSSVRPLVRDCEIVCNGASSQYCINLAGGAASGGNGPTAPTVSGCTLSIGNAANGNGIRISGAAAATVATIVGNYIYTSAGGIILSNVVGCSLIGNQTSADCATVFTINSQATDVTEFGNSSANATPAFSDLGTAGFNEYTSPRSGRWAAGYTGTSTSTAVTGAYAVNNAQFNQHHVKGTAAGITITISNPSTTPPTPGATISFFLENASGGAVTFAFGTNYRVAAVAPANGTGIGLAVSYNAALAKWVEISRGTAA